MKTAHIVLFVLAITTVIGSLAGVIILFWKAFQAAKGRFPRTSFASEDNAMQWTEGGALTLLAQRTMGRVNRVITGLTIKPFPQNVLPMMDPVDGTPFQEGENITRCLCGTNYHMHSWQWLMEKAGGRCVNCKRLTSSQKVLA